LQHENARTKGCGREDPGPPELPTHRRAETSRDFDLRTLGREVEMIRYQDESHVMLAIGRPDRRVDRIERIVGWFQKHLEA
jgi:hypothetical protein